MDMTRRHALAAGSAFAFAAPAARAAVTVVRPESVGYSTAGLRAFGDEMKALVDRKKLAGVTTLVARRGRVAHFEAYGKADEATGAPIERDTIFRIASMTKPIAGVAMMQLWEQGKWKLDDPVARHIPQFAGLKVKAADGTLVDQQTPMTMAQLMSHTAGFDVSAGYTSAALNSTDLQGMIDKLAKLPLAAQPGADWRYGPSVDLQGYVVERLSGMGLDAYLQRHIFDPLKMPDTGFWVDPSKAGRVARIHTYRAGLIVPNGERNTVRTSKPAFLSGSGGLMSTAEDYFRFAQALLNGGTLDGARILKADTIKLMRTNVLRPGVKVDLYGPNQEGVGFGLDFAVIMDPRAAETPQGLNTFYWGGAYGTWFWIDPTHEVVMVGMIQNLNGSRPDSGTPRVREISPRLTYAALTNRRA